MRRIPIAAAAAAFVLTGAGAASAADMVTIRAIEAPVVAPPVWSWTGPYAGLIAGYGWGDVNATAPFDPLTGFFYNFGGASYDVDSDGFFGGAVAGYDWQFDRLVFGLRGELGYLGLDGSALDPNGVVLGFPDTTTSFDSDFYGALYGRAGLAFDRVLITVKGGAAFLNADASTVDPCIAPPSGCGTEMLRMDGSKTMAGWTVGVGLEWALGNGWSLTADYAYLDFGSLDVSGVSSAGDRYGQSLDVTANVVSIGVNRRF